MENKQVEPLTDVEIKQGIAAKVAEAVMAKLDMYGPIFGKSYPKFRCYGVLQLELDNFGLKAYSSHAVTTGAPLVEAEILASTVEVDIPETPPDQFRQETDQPIPVVVERGVPVERAVFSKVGRRR